MRESLIAQIRNPTQAFVKRTRAINYGNCYYFQTAELKDLDTLDADAACRHFNKCYKNPAEYTVCLTGQLEVNTCVHLSRNIQGLELDVSDGLLLLVLSSEWFHDRLLLH